MGSNIVVINGKHYDAKTGRLLETKKSASSTPHKQNGPSLDGVSRRASSAREVAAHSVHKKTEKSKTLMRGAVKKPANTKLHATSHAASAHKKQSHHPAGHPVINHERSARATHVSKSSLISRFGASPVAPAKKHSQSIAHLPVKNAPVITTHHSAPVSTGIPNPFAKAVENASSHTEAAPKKMSRRQKVARRLRISPRMVSVSSFVMAGLLLGGFFVYQNIPNLAMRVAAARAGVNASLPGYKPAGFAMNGPIKYSTGKISISYRSTTDGRNFQVTQANSEWNSETLLENFVAVDRRPYQTYQDKGKTIYIYDDSNATWIDGGVWYQVEGSSSLNSDQLLRIANSL